MITLVEIPPPAQQPQSQTLARHLLVTLNTELERRVDLHRRQFRLFWDSQTPPDDILADIGANARVFLQSARINLASIDELAKLVGKALTDAISPADFIPRREFIEAEDGSATLAPPAEGFDAWGRPII
jgi:hypothetical protein